MSNKAVCPACNSYLSGVYEALEGERSGCPNCGLSGDVMREVEAARKAKADADLTAKTEEALVRAGKAEAEVRDLKRQLAGAKELARKILDGWKQAAWDDD